MKAFIREFHHSIRLGRPLPFKLRMRWNIGTGILFAGLGISRWCRNRQDARFLPYGVALATFGVHIRIRAIDEASRRLIPMERADGGH